MCTTVIWAINAAAYGESLLHATERRLGVAPQPTTTRIAASCVRPSAVHFTLTRRMCDCDALVGLRDRPAEPGEIPAPALLGWLHDLPSLAPHVTRLAVLPAWNPADVVTPARALSVSISAVDEPLLRDIRADHVVAIEYAPSVSGGR
ncbi:hypothetical protein [Pseudactinotalea terrae]|uniref:hypothetical protein n=1 Tax=Pseudactinotalea terrae TaxID=1743262 RepID=UPI0012E11778|nr:hypothetical protein [Pseudactinotalea terrae]